MATQTAQQLQEKDFLQKLNIRTMKKDLKQLRESDSLKERDKIGKLNPAKSVKVDVAKVSQDVKEFASATPPPQPVAVAPDLPAPEAFKTAAPKAADLSIMAQQDAIKKADQLIEKIIPKPAAPEDVSDIKKFATELEKQQIFQLQSQRQSIQSQIKNHSKAGDPSLSLDKNNILQEQTQWRQKLTPLIQEEEKNETQQKAIEDKEVTTKVPEEKQALEKQRWALEEKQRDIEKKRWSVEENLSKLEDKMKGLNESYKQYNGQGNSLQQELVTIDNSLKTIYSAIAQRQNLKKEEVQQAFAQAPPPTPFTPPLPPQPSRPYLKDVPQAAREKLATTAEVEQKQRLKFMEDVEKWAKEQEKNKQTNTNPQI